MTAVALAVYLVLKIEDVMNYHLGAYLFNFNLEGILFWAEILIGVLIPITMLLIPKIRMSKRGLYYSALFAIVGFVLNRMNVSVTSLERYYDGFLLTASKVPANNIPSFTSYFPSWMEIVTTLMIVAIGFGAFGLAVKNLNVLPKEKRVPPDNFEVVIIDDAVPSRSAQTVSKEIRLTTGAEPRA